MGRSGYLAGAFSRCHDELQTLRRRAGKADVALAVQGLEVAKTQLVNFSATCLMEVSEGARARGREGAAGIWSCCDGVFVFCSTARAMC